MKHISIYLAVSLAVVTLVIGLGVGYYFTPEYQLSMYERNDMSLGPADRSLDLRYVNAMASHHKGAMLLAEQVKDVSEREEIKSLATEILKNEPVLINELYAWKKEWYGDVRSSRDPQVAKLGSYDEKLDLRFLNALIAHHEAGITMTNEVRLKSSRKEVLNNADAVGSFLNQSLVMLKNWRESWYGVK